jgi:hypothetical protein
MLPPVNASFDVWEAGALAAVDGRSDGVGLSVFARGAHDDTNSDIRSVLKRSGFITPTLPVCPIYPTAVVATSKTV